MKHKHNNTEPEFIDTFGCSHIGTTHAVNTDQFLIAELKRAAKVHHASSTSLDDSRRFGDKQAHVLLVADGESDRYASSLVVDDVLQSILNAVPWTQDLDVDSEAQLRLELKETVVRCNEHVVAAERKSSSSSNLTSTLTLAFVRWPTAFIVHAGDSRAYLIRDGEIAQLTTDHTVAQQMVEDGALDAEKAETSSFAHELWNAVGGDSRVKPELTVQRLECGDALLLCSGGLTTRLSDGAIRKIVDSPSSTQRACEELVRTVVSLGSQDDVTVAMARFQDAIAEQAKVLELPTRGRGAAAKKLPESRAVADLDAEPIAATNEVS